jgi:hypothetical protein
VEEVVEGEVLDLIQLVKFVHQMILGVVVVMGALLIRLPNVRLMVLGGFVPTIAVLVFLQTRHLVSCVIKVSVKIVDLIQIVHNPLINVNLLDPFVDLLVQVVYLKLRLL